MKKIVAISLLAVSFASAGMRGVGEYSGGVVRDRWGGVYLYSGVYLTYVSESVKSKLADVVGQPVVVNVLDIDQPINPGDARIKELALLATDPKEDEWVPVHDLSLEVGAAFGRGSQPRFLIQMQNRGQREARLVADALGMTVLTPRPSNCTLLEPSDGPSVALLTRQAFWGSDGRVGHGRTKECGITCSWKLTRGGLGKPLITLQPGEFREWSVGLDLPPGEYEFLAGYGGGVHDSLGLVSNQIAFDIDASGKAAVVLAPRVSAASPSNNPIKMTVRSVTPLAVASVAPVRPAAYRVRWAD